MAKITQTSKPQTTKKPTSKPRKRTNKKNIQEEVSNSITPRNILIASIAGLTLAIILIVSNIYYKADERT